MTQTSNMDDQQMTIMFLNPKLEETLFPKMTNQHFQFPIQFNGKINM